MDDQRQLSISDGLRAFAGGIGFVLTTPRVWPYAVVPAIIMLLLTIGLSILGVYGAGWLTDLLFGEELSTWGKVGYWTVLVLFAILGVLLAAVVALALAQPLSGFALDAIARIREESLTCRPVQSIPFLKSFVNGVKVAVVTLATGGLALAGLLVLDLVFPPALVVTIPAKFLLVAWLLAWDFHDYAFGLHGLGLRARLGWVRKNLGAFTAFGAAWSLCVIVPGIVLILLPMGVAGAAGLVVESGVGMTLSNEH
jgi:CysZ protein